MFHQLNSLWYPHLYARLPVLTFVWYILGMLVMLFLQCMVALFSPVHRGGEGIKWWLVSYTVAVFSFVTVYIATNLHIQSVSFVDNRETGAVYRGPMQYQAAVRSTALGLILDLMFNLNNWLADGLLVSPLPDAAPTRPGVNSCLTPIQHLDLSLLHYLLHEPLDYRHSLPLVPRVFGYAFDSPQVCSDVPG